MAYPQPSRSSISLRPPTPDISESHIQTHQPRHNIIILGQLRIIQIHYPQSQPRLPPPGRSPYSIRSGSVSARNRRVTMFIPSTYLRVQLEWAPTAIHFAWAIPPCSKGSPTAEQKLMNQSGAPCSCFCSHPPSPSVSYRGWDPDGSPGWFWRWAPGSPPTARAIKFLTKHF